jgi:hypothetical protein
MAKKAKPAERPKWHLTPPDIWYEAMPEGWSLQNWTNEYYKRHPERLPPRELLKQLRQARLPSEEELCIEEARSGDPTALVMHLANLRDRGAPPTSIVFDFLIEQLEAKRGKAYHDRLREIRRSFIVATVEHHLKEGMPLEKAVQEAARLHKCSRPTVYRALKLKDRFSEQSSDEN